ncbi:MAG: hypothetical protein H6R08_1686 [Proteobacteria bacterium]|nr:hypothetical protein [Pseudomonadota bacterium]
MPVSRDLLSRTLRTPDIVTHFSIGKWDLLIRQARAADLLAHLAHRFRQRGLTAAIPAMACWHFDAAETLADKQHIALRWELLQLRDALADIGSPLVVLKSTTYVTVNPSTAEEQRFNGIDILVPHGRLPLAESVLARAHWHALGLSEYDQRYRRRWMHQAAPMQHPQRAVVVNVHHAVPSDRAHAPLDAARLRHRAIAVDNFPGVHVLAVEDRVLHAATHLFHDGELSHGLRDLTDLDLLLLDAAVEADFWTRLVARASELQLGRSLFYALRYLRYFLDTPIPASVFTALHDSTPNRVTLALMDSIFTRALAPVHASCADAYTPAARLAAFGRAHWLRMPAHQLLPHLFHQAYIRTTLDNNPPKAA